MLKLIHASKIYAKNGICALNAVDLTVQDGDYISVTGASGSGKSTLMHILGLLDSLTDGEYLARRSSSRAFAGKTAGASAQ